MNSYLTGIVIAVLVAIVLTSCGPRNAGHTGDWYMTDLSGLNRGMAENDRDNAVCEQVAHETRDRALAAGSAYNQTTPVVTPHLTQPGAAQGYTAYQQQARSGWAIDYALAASERAYVNCMRSRGWASFRSRAERDAFERGMK